MSSLFGNYFGSSSANSESNRFVGETVDLGDGNRLKIKKVIAEGGYGYIFVAQDMKTGLDYALKRQVVSSENVKIIKREIAFLKQLGDHPHIVQYIASAGSPPSLTSHGSAEFLIQTELCTGGSMEAVLEGAVLTPRQVLRVFYATCSAVAAMHALIPPVTHRDIKIENLLLTGTGVVKLCDFGSATTQQVNPEPSWSYVQRGLAEEEIQQNTTPMYRSPEMIDLYSNNPVNNKADIWALGCLLFNLCFRVHPFEDSAKLGILNANYRLPSSDTSFTMFHDIIKSCLVVHPQQRPSVDEITAQLFTLSDILRVDLEKPLSELLDAPQDVHPPSATPSDSSDSASVGGVSAWQSTSQQAHRFLGFMKGGADSLFKTIKDSSSKAINSISNAQKHSLDITYITSRILVMSQPSDNQLEEIKSFLDERHPSAYLVFNVSGQSYDVSKLNNQVYDFAWPRRGTPDLEKVVDLCRSMDAWLRADLQNVIVVHCQDGIMVTSVTVASYLLFLGLVPTPIVALNFFWRKRSPDRHRLMPSPSDMRYLQHLVQLVDKNLPFKPHPHTLVLNTLKLSSVPLFNAIRTGCKPFVEVFQDGERIYTSASHDTMEKIHSFHADDGEVGIPLGVSVRGNVVVVLHHIRAIPVARKAGMGMTAVRMFQFQLHTGFLDSNTNSFVLERHDLDGSLVQKIEKFPSPFRVSLEVEWERDTDIVLRAASWQNLPYPKTTPLVCFSSRVEENEVLKLIADSDNKNTQHSHPHSFTSTHPHSSTSTPPNSTSTQSPVHTSSLQCDEESTSAGGGNLLNFNGVTVMSSRDPYENREEGTHHMSDGQELFSQLDWQRQKAELAGYAAFCDQGAEYESDSSSSSSGIEFHRNTFPSHSSTQEQTNNVVDDCAITNFGPFANTEGCGPDPVELRTTAGREERRDGPQEPKLIEFGNSETTNPKVSIRKPEPVVPESMCDPWETTSHYPYYQGKSDLEVSNLLGLDVSDDHSQLSDVQSEVRTVGAEQFTDRLEKMSSNDKRKLSSDFDPFGPLISSKQGGEGTPVFSLLAEPLPSQAQVLHPSQAQTSHHSQSHFDPFGPVPTLHTLSAPTQHSGLPRNVSTPATLSSLGRVGPPTGTAVPNGKIKIPALDTLTTSTLGKSSSFSQPNLLDDHYQFQPISSNKAGTTSSYKTSPMGGSLRSSPVPFAPHSASSDNIASGDPFAQFNIQQMAGNKATSGKPRVSATSQPAQKTVHPAYKPYYMQQNQHSMSHVQPPIVTSSVHTAQASSMSGSAAAIPLGGSNSIFGPRSTSPRSNYNPVMEPGTRTGIPQKPKGDAFGDLLGSNFNPKRVGESRTLKDLKTENAIGVTLDPDKAKVAAWADRKERNIRALISSLHEVLWEGEARWTEVGMHQLLQPDQVKTYFRRACLSVHPDKTQETEHEILARAIFDELNDAYTRFEDSGSKPLF